MLDLLVARWLAALHLLLTAAAAWSIGGIVGTLADLLVRTEPRLGTSEHAAGPSGAVAPALRDEKLWLLLGLEPPADAVPGGPSRDRDCDDVRARPVPSGLRLSLVGAVLSERPRSFLASLADVETGARRTVMVGDRIGDAEVLGLERLAAEDDLTGNGFRLVVVLCRGGTREYLEYQASEPEGSGTRLPGAPSRGAAAGKAGPVRSLGNERYEVERAVVEAALGDPGQLSAVRVLPWIENGAIGGLRVASIQTGSILSAIGLEDGDVIRRVNGYEIDSLEKALELLQRLRGAGHLAIDVERGGRSIRKEVRMTAG